MRAALGAHGIVPSGSARPYKLAAASRSLTRCAGFEMTAGLSFLVGRAFHSHGIWPLWKAEAFRSSRAALGCRFPLVKSTPQPCEPSVFRAPERFSGPVSGRRNPAPVLHSRSYRTATARWQHRMVIPRRIAVPAESRTPSGGTRYARPAGLAPFFTRGEGNAAIL